MTSQQELQLRKQLAAAQSELTMMKEQTRVSDEAFNFQLKRANKLMAEQEQYLKAFSHIHKSNGVDDTCATCGLDLRNPIHKRECDCRRPGYVSTGECTCENGCLQTMHELLASPRNPRKG